jgi:hypothetical protein
LPTLAAASAAGKGCIQRCTGDPEIAHALQVIARAGNLRARVGEQIEDTDLPGVIAQPVSFSDGSAQRQHLVALAERNIVRRAQPRVGLAYLRASLERRLAETRERLGVAGFGLAHPRCSRVENRHLEAHLEAALVRGRARPLLDARRPGVEDVHEPGRARQVQIRGERVEIRVHRLEVDALVEGGALDLRKLLD